MALQPNQRLGPYEILVAIGVGGMGEVYRARDTRLDRIIAIKVLPAHLADRAELRERFEREARTIASLKRPCCAVGGKRPTPRNTCVLHNIGRHDGMVYLVLEYFEGGTLAERSLEAGAVSSDQLHKRFFRMAPPKENITYRDSKPGNILLTKSGTKLLEFGLAKLNQEATPIAPLSQRPTTDSAMTAKRTILGTLQYVAPEQVEGKTNEIDAPTDSFAFGAVVHDVATEKKAFEGKTCVIGKIMESNPPSMASLQPMTRPQLDRVVKPSFG